MADLVIGYDPSQPVGQRLPAEVRAEINVIAPSTVNDGDITDAKLDDNAVTTRAIKPGAVTSEKIANGGVQTINIGDGQVTAGKLAPGAVTPDVVAPGVVTAVDSAGNAQTVKIMHVTAAEYAAITSPDPNTDYFISS